MDLDVSTGLEPGELGPYHASWRGSNDRGEVEPYHRPKEQNLVRDGLKKAVTTNLVPEELIVKVFGVRFSRKFAPDANESERDFSGHDS